MKDVAGQELAVGDRVAIAVTGYRTMTVGTIVRFTPKGMKVLFKKPWITNAREEETFREPDMVSKVPSRGPTLKPLAPLVIEGLPV